MAHTPILIPALVLLCLLAAAPTLVRSQLYCAYAGNGYCTTPTSLANVTESAVKTYLGSRITNSASLGSSFNWSNSWAFSKPATNQLSFSFVAYESAAAGLANSKTNDLLIAISSTLSQFCYGAGDAGQTASAAQVCQSPSPSPSPTRTPTPSNTPSNTPTPSRTPTPSNTPSPSSTPSNTPSNSPSFSPTRTPSNTPSSSSTPSPSNSPSPSPSSSATPSPSSSSTPSPSTSRSNSPAPSPSSSSTPSPSNSPSPSPSSSSTPTPSSSPTPSSAPTQSPAPPDTALQCCVYLYGPDATVAKTLCAPRTCPPSFAQYGLVANWTMPACSTTNCFFR